MEDCALSTSLAKECVVVRGDPMFPAFCEKRFADGVVINKTHLRFEIVAPRCEKANFWLGSLPSCSRSVSVPSAAQGPAHTYTPFQSGCYPRLPFGCSVFRELASSSAPFATLHRSLSSTLSRVLLVFSSSRSMYAKHFMVVCSASR